MSTLQQQARALGDPTRHAVFRHIAAADEPVGIAELTERFAFNHNAIRQHLAKLVGAGLVVEATAPVTGPGRPRLVYTLDPAADGLWGTTGPYERLSRLLADIITTGLSPEEVGRRAADEFRVPSPSDDVVADLTAAMARQGFAPEVRPVRGGAQIVLHNCPFASTAPPRVTRCAPSTSASPKGSPTAQRSSSTSSWATTRAGPTVASDCMWLIPFPNNLPPARP